LKPKPKVTNRNGWGVDLPPFGFHRSTRIRGFRTHRQAFGYALRWVETHGGGTATVARAPDLVFHRARLGWPVIR